MTLRAGKLCGKVGPADPCRTGQGSGGARGVVFGSLQDFGAASRALQVG